MAQNATVNQDIPLMPKATAVWLVENTTLDFQQIAEFCGMHPLEVQGIADGEVAIGIIGQDPIASGQLAEEELRAAEKDPKRKLKLNPQAKQYIKQKAKGGRYTPVARRREKPEAIAWLVKHHPEITDAQIMKLVGTTKKTIEGIRNRTHWNMQNIKARDPVLLGVCTQIDLDKAIARAKLDQPVAPVAPEAETGSEPQPE